MELDPPLLGPLVDNPVSFFLVSRQAHKGGGGVTPLRAPTPKSGLLDEGRVPRGVQGRAGA